MSVLQIREAKREGARTVIGLQGISGSGKTRTAIELAWGLAGYDSSKVGFLDTENRRGSLYADVLKNAKGEVQPFLIGDLVPPFSPQRYAEAIHEFEKAGVEVLVIDSVSHEWAGNGGCLDIASQSKGPTGWKNAKGGHKQFMSAMLQSPKHVIACIRETEKVDWTNPKDPQKLGLLPVQEKEFVFELTASLQMRDNGKAQGVLKCPEELLPILGRGQGYITSADGKAIRDWVYGADVQDPAVARYRDRLLAVTERGEAFIKESWAKVPTDVRTALGDDFHDQILTSARAFDEQSAAESGADTDLDALNASVGG